ncbi:hypothetical protein [Yersinia phage vB_YenM_P778]
MNFEVNKMYTSNLGGLFTCTNTAKHHVFKILEMPHEEMELSMEVSIDTYLAGHQIVVSADGKHTYSNLQIKEIERTNMKLELNKIYTSNLGGLFKVTRLLDLSRDNCDYDYIGTCQMMEKPTEQMVLSPDCASSGYIVGDFLSINRQGKHEYSNVKLQEVTEEAEPMTTQDSPLSEEIKLGDVYTSNFGGRFMVHTLAPHGGVSKMKVLEQIPRTASLSGFTNYGVGDFMHVNPKTMFHDHSNVKFIRSNIGQSYQSLATDVQYWKSRALKAEEEHQKCGKLYDEYVEQQKEVILDLQTELDEQQHLTDVATDTVEVLEQLVTKTAQALKDRNIELGAARMQILFKEIRERKSSKPTQIYSSGLTGDLLSQVLLNAVQQAATCKAEPLSKH